MRFNFHLPVRLSLLISLCYFCTTWQTFAANKDAIDIQVAEELVLNLRIKNTGLIPVQSLKATIHPENRVQWLKLVNRTTPKIDLLSPADAVTLPISIQTEWDAPINTMDVFVINLSDQNGHSWKVEIPVRVRDKIPEISRLLPNYPNPFNPETWMPYELSEQASVTIQIYNTYGILVKSLMVGLKPAGTYLSKPRAAYWDGTNEIGERVASGIYFYVLKAGRFQSTRKMVIVK